MNIPVFQQVRHATASVHQGLNSNDASDHYTFAGHLTSVLKEHEGEMHHLKMEHKEALAVKKACIQELENRVKESKLSLRRVARSGYDVRLF